MGGLPLRERITRQVLVENLDLLVGQREKTVEIRRLKTTADRLIADVVEDADLILDGVRQECPSRLRPR